MKQRLIADALLDEERRHAAVLRAVRREELLLEWHLESELRSMRAKRRGSRPLDDAPVMGA